ncbi:hypothetical protein HPULCUR_009718 [Helicostylum pulchrum]|uniref:Uncharacterized protein n=1 Tax=Helicostylum pulchrum TaxID=562976 RepID=A0ABP9YBA1_9FUNG
MCHLNIKLKDALNTVPIRDEGFRHSDLSLNVNKPSVLPGSCAQCDRPTLYCICSKNTNASKRRDIGYTSSSSSDGSLTPPVYQLSYVDTPPIRSAGLNVNNNTPSNTASGSTTTTTTNNTTTISPTIRPNHIRHHLTIPIHDPSDDINSDTPIYKSHEESIISDKTAVLGEFTNTSSEDLMNQIYSGFIDKDSNASSCTSSPLLREADHQLAELSKE